ncbi:hypothetical protein [Candidatus Enterovibrio escicola]|uniref:hypothetical protein n=1 Tax=Candidatus Enterovibrio escicola TaxID=1927127 RepID=UPI001CC22BB9|nr:hypothetical protein [Candidatus Enterovibrio escacola]
MSKHRIVFSKNTPGTAQLTIKGFAEPRQVVAIELGWGESLHRVFTGFIERVSHASPGYVCVFCRESAAILYHPLNLVMRHPTMHQLLGQITQRTGLTFVVPDKIYLKTVIPCFYSTGNGYRVLDAVGAAFSIKDFIWQQDGAGKIFVGSWSDSLWANKTVTIPFNICNPHTSLKTVTVPCTPHFKPNVVVNKRRLVTVEHIGAESVITWT